MSLKLLIFIFLFLFLIITFLIRRSDLLSPGRLFSLVWIIVLGLCVLKLSRYQYEWSWYSWVVILTTLISFLLGIYIVYVLNIGKNFYPIPYTRKTQLYQYELNTYAVFKVIIFLFSVYIISYLVIYLTEGFLPAFSKRPDQNRSTWGLFGFSIFIHLTPIIIYLCSIYILKHKGIFKKIIISIILLLTFISFLLLEQRFSLIFAILLIIVYVYYSTQKFNLKNSILLTIPILLIIYGISTLRESALFIFYTHYLSQMKYPIHYALFTEPYMYLVMNVENFAYAIDNIKHHTYGLYSFDFLLALSGLKHFLKEYFNITDFPALRTFLYNTYTMFFVYYRDFGLIGSFIGPFLIGFIISHFYYKMRFSPNFHTISFYGIFVVAIFFSYFVPLFSWLHFVFNIIVLYIISRYIHNKSNSYIT